MISPIMDNLIPLSSKKPIYTHRDNTDLFVKVFDLKNTNIEDIYREIHLQTIGSTIKVSPHIVRSYQDSERFYVVMKRIKGHTIADLFGANRLDTPQWIWDEIRRILKELFVNGVEYIDVTPYNFMIEDISEKIYVIDYGHAKKIEINWFLNTFINGSNKWNPEFE